MALVKCYECNKEISDKTAACPSCGAPQLNGATMSSPLPKETKTSTSTWLVLALIIIIGGLFFQSSEFKEQNLPILPIDVGVRNAALGPGKVLKVANKSDKTLMVVVSLNNPTTQQKHSFRLDIPAGGINEIGHIEGWIVASGDLIEIRNDSYKTWKGNAP